MRLLLVVAQLEIADRLALSQRGRQLLEHGQLALIGLALGRRAVAARGLQLLDSLLDD